MLKESTFYEKPINDKMTKKELLEVIDFMEKEIKNLRQREITPEEEVNRLISVA